MRKHGPIRRKVYSPRNSTTVLPWRELDFRHWWIDTSFKSFYLHVRHADGERWSRVRCRLSEKPRLEMRDGILFWLIDKERRR